MSNHPNSFWGEFQENVKLEPEDYNISLGDVEELVLPLSSPPQLYQPSPEETASFQILPNDMYESDPIVLHTIRLLQHQDKLIQLLTSAQTYGLDVSCNMVFPEEPEVRKKTTKSKYLNFLPPKDSLFSLGINKGPKLEIEASTARLILRKATATICAHSGFTDTNESVLRLLSDVAHDFLTKITSLLRVNKDTMMAKGSCPFHDVMEQTLHDMRLGGISELHSMYQERVFRRHTKVKHKTIAMHNQYLTLISQASAQISRSITPQEDRKIYELQANNKACISYPATPVEEK